jgi:hypothetical protein
MSEHNLFVREMKALDMVDNLEATVQVHWQFVNNLKQPTYYHAVHTFCGLTFVNNFILAVVIISYPIYIYSQGLFPSSFECPHKQKGQIFLLYSWTNILSKCLFHRENSRYTNQYSK